MKEPKKTTMPFASTLLAGMLLASAVSAQSVTDYQLIRPPTVFPPVVVQRPGNATPIRIDVPGGNRAWPGVPAVDPQTGIVAAVAEIVHRVTESWIPNRAEPGLRGGLVRLGVYDR